MNAPMGGFTPRASARLGDRSASLQSNDGEDYGVDDRSLPLHDPAPVTGESGLGGTEARDPQRGRRCSGNDDLRI